MRHRIAMLALSGLLCVPLAAIAQVGGLANPGAPATVVAPTPAAPKPSAPATVAPTVAAPTTAVPSSQQDLMKTCNTSASGRSLKGDARKNYMSACLSGKGTQTGLMKVCNMQAGQDKLAGDARKTYMASCLKTSN